MDISYSGFDELMPFTNIDATSVMGLLGQVGEWLNQLGGSSALDADIQLAAGTTLGDVLNLGGAFSDGLLGDLLNGVGSPLEGAPKFDSVQSLASTLESVLGLPPGTINAQYDDTSKELSYHVLVDHTFDVFSLPFDLALDLDPVVELQSTGLVNFDVTTQLELTFGLDLGRFSASVVAPIAAPANGQLSADAHFSVSAGGGLPVNVTLPQSATTGNASLDDLVIDINVAIAATTLGGDVVAARDLNDNTRLTLTTTHVGPVVALVFGADANDPAVTELGFDSTQFGFDAGFDDLFIEDASVSATAALEALDVDATADFGYVQVSIVDGTASVDFTASLDVQDPGTQTIGGRVYLDELFSAVATDISQVIDGPNFTGSLDALLPIEGQILAIPITGDPDVTIEWNDFFTGQPTIEFNNFDDLLNFENVTDQQIVDSLAQLGIFLADMQSFSLYDQVIPGLNKTVGEVFDYASEFLTLIGNFSADPNGTLNELEGKLETALNLPDSLLDISSAENGDVIRFDVTLADSISTDVPINFDLGPQLNNIIDLMGSAELHASAGVAFELDFGIDISDVENPRAFLYETTGLELTALALGTDIDFTAAWNTFGLFIKDGTFAVDGDGNPATAGDSVTLTAALTDGDPMTTNGKIFFDELDLGDIDLSFNGQVKATLPMFFPTASQFKGNIELTVTDLADIGNSTTLEFPEEELEEENDDFDMLNNLGSILDTVDFVMTVVRDAFNGEVFGVELPFLGNDFEKAAGFIEEVRIGFLQEVRDRFQEANNQTPEVLRQALFDGLGPAGLNLLKDANGSGTVTTDDVTVTLADFDNDGEDDDSFQFDFVLKKELGLLDEEIQFDIGLDALGLELDGNIE